MCTLSSICSNIVKIICHQPDLNAHFTSQRPSPTLKTLQSPWIANQHPEEFKQWTKYRFRLWSRFERIILPNQLWGSDVRIDFQGKQEYFLQRFKTLQNRKFRHFFIGTPPDDAARAGKIAIFHKSLLHAICMRPVLRKQLVVKGQNFLLLKRKRNVFHHTFSSKEMTFIFLSYTGLLTGS